MDLFQPVVVSTYVRGAKMPQKEAVACRIFYAYLGETPPILSFKDFIEVPSGSDIRFKWLVFSCNGDRQNVSDFIGGKLELETIAGEVVLTQPVLFDATDNIVYANIQGAATEDFSGVYLSKLTLEDAFVNVVRFPSEYITFPVKIVEV